jgi:glutamine amidotransferase
MKVAIIKYGMGNVASVEKTVKKLGHIPVLTDDHAEISAADLIILPGVGSFTKAMDNLEHAGLVKVLGEEVIEKKKPFLGICLGMQLVATHGTEPSDIKGLGWIDGEVIRITDAPDLRIPHLGWNNVRSARPGSLYEEFDGQDYYFIHSYHFVPSNKNDVVLYTDYDQSLVAAVQRDNIHAMQFHPEKSQDAGMALLKKVFDLYA